MTGNKPEQIVVIGASAAGLKAAVRAKRLLPDTEITVLDQDSYISYGACGMPYFVSGDIQSANALRETSYGVIRDPEFFKSAKGINVLTETRVERIDRDSRTIRCTSIPNETVFELTYDRLVIAAGSIPIMLPGVTQESESITTFKTLHQAIKIRQSLQKGRIGKVGIIGGGFIGCELAEAFSVMWGVEVILIEGTAHILPSNLDGEMASKVEAYMTTESIELHTNCKVNEIVDNGNSAIIKTSQGEFEVDLAVIAVGVRPNSKLAADCGLEIGSKGGIVVDENMTTSDPNIYAAGDCVQLKHLISNKRVYLPLGSLANRQGRVIGSNLGGRNETFGLVIGSSAVKIFDMNIASTGLTEKCAKEAGFNTGSAWGTFSDKADYYPESQNIHLKIIYDKDTGRLLGLQGYGMGEVVKRVDVFAALLKHKGSLEDLLDMEFCYAPPYSPALDPLYALGCTARNALYEGIEQMAPNTKLSDYAILDVRQSNEVEANPLQNAQSLHIPFMELREKLDAINKDQPVIIMCAKGIRSGESTRILKDKGLHDVKYIGGGMSMKCKD